MIDNDHYFKYVCIFSAHILLSISLFINIIFFLDFIIIVIFNNFFILINTGINFYFQRKNKGGHVFPASLIK